MRLTLTIRGMADETKIGTRWQDDELDAIVSDYFNMLAAELSGQPYVKDSGLQAQEELLECPPFSLR
jgi:hypothetical protein